MPKPSIVFLMYHELEVPHRRICQDEPGYSRYVLTEAQFLSQIQYLKENAWQALSVGQALKFPTGRSVVITFDDGCETDLLVAAPILRQAGFTATFFITSGRLGTAGYLSFAQLKELQELGFEIGSHSISHAYLTDLDDAALQREMSESKAQLERIIGQTVAHFSCPGGRCDQRVIQMAQTVGYQTLSTSRIRANTTSTDHFALGRVAVVRDISLPAFAAICNASGLARMRTQSTLRGTAKRLLGNALYDRLRTKLLDSKKPST
ncbi:MAG TPA: polysaccharide deacetylase family protein [Verrucomicrobiae bacterium]|nr:polysaccharide deacetylase family protein [Verrucomicrobiae bacterium]